MSSVSQGFDCKIPAEKVPFGWWIGTDRDAIRMPFNPLVRCRVDVETNELLHLEPIVVSGSINHVNGVGNTWVLSDVAMTAIEQVTGRWRTHQQRMNAQSDIVSFQISNVEDTSCSQRRGCSYFIHDPNERGVNQPWKWTVGQKVSFSMKLSTRSNVTHRGAPKDKFVQCWNVKAM